MIHLFTSAAPNYVGKVRALCESLRRHWPSVMTHWAVADLPNEQLLDNLGDGEIDEILFVDDLEVGHDAGWMFKHNVVELSTAIKAEVALSLLDGADCELLVYLDPDIVVFSALDDLVDELRSASIALTPHLLRPEQETEAVEDNELCALRHGVFNLGFFGVRNCEEGKRFLKWWRERCQAYCWGDWRTGVFTDQKWVNFAPAFFPDTSILRSPRFNVAPWNINQRCLEGTFEEGFLVDDEPLGFYHFTGFDSGAHRQMIDKYSDNNPAAHMLMDWYQHRIDYLTPPEETPWKLGSYANGCPIMPQHRQIYRERPDLQVAFPDPYQTPQDRSCFFEWLSSCGTDEYPELLGGNPSIGDLT